MNRLKQLALSYFAAHGIEAEAGTDTIVTRHGRYGLLNLAQHLSQLPEDRWELAVEEHLDRLREVTLDVPSGYAEAQHRLRVRLAGTSDVHAAFTRPVADRLTAVLMIKIPEGGMSVTADAVREWGVPIDQVWRDAATSTQWDEPHRFSRLRSPAGDRFTRVDGSFWSSSLLADLGSLLPDTAGSGALAVVPCHDLLVYQPLRSDPPWVDMLSLASAMFKLGPGSISPDVFWWHEGRVERVVEFGRKGPVPHWSTRFRSALDGLGNAA